MELLFAFKIEHLTWYIGLSVTIILPLAARWALRKRRGGKE